MTLKPALRIGNRYQNPVPTSVGGPSMMFKVLKLYVQNKDERTPKQKLGPFNTDIRIYEQPPPSGMRITWFGHSSSLLEIDGLRILIDPVWDQRAAPVEWAGPNASSRRHSRSSSCHASTPSRSRTTTTTISALVP